MPEEQNDLNKASVVTEQDLNKADVVNQQDLNQSVTDEPEKLADGTDDNKTVPYVELKKAIDEKNAAEQRAQETQTQMAVLQANQQPVQTVQTVQPKTTLEQAMSELNVVAGDMFGDVMVNVMNRKAELDTAIQQSQAAYNVNAQFITNHPDFTQVVGSVNPATGAVMAWSQEALLLQQKKTYLAGAFQSAQGAYQAIMDERKLVEFEKKATVNQEQQNRQELENASLPLGGSAAGGGGAGDTQNQSMMTREQVLEIEEKLANNENI